MTSISKAIACAANSKGVDGSLQVSYNFCYNMKSSTHVSMNLDNTGNDSAAASCVLYSLPNKNCSNVSFQYQCKVFSSLNRDLFVHVKMSKLNCSSHGLCTIIPSIAHI